MIPYEELDRALARWKTRQQGGIVDGPRTAEIEVMAVAEEVVVVAPIAADEPGSLPEPIPVPGERTGEIDLAEVESYEDPDES